MAHRSKVPKFGNWESGENVPYTVYFDKARKERTGTKMINPNDPEDNPDLFSETEGGEDPSQIPSPPRARPEADEFKASPARGDQFRNRPATGGRRGSAGSEYSIEKSPLHHQARASSEYSIDRSPLHHQARVSGRGNNGSPSYESVKNSRDNSYGTPGRSRLGGASRGDELDKGSTLPKFGEWDEKNPASANGYTHIFNKVREEKHGGQTNGTTGSSYRSAAASTNRTQSNDSMCCCFPWSRK